MPKLEPVQECNVVPKETCQLKFSKPNQVKKPIITKWCLDESLEDIAESKSACKDCNEKIDADLNVRFHVLKNSQFLPYHYET